MMSYLLVHKTDKVTYSYVYVLVYICHIYNLRFILILGQVVTQSDLEISYHHVILKEPILVILVISQRSQITLGSDDIHKEVREFSEVTIFTKEPENSRR